MAGPLNETTNRLSSASSGSTSSQTTSELAWVAKARSSLKPTSGARLKKLSGVDDIMIDSPLSSRIVELEAEETMDQEIGNLEAELREMQNKLADREDSFKRLEELMVQRDQQLKEAKEAKDEAARLADNIIPERDYFKNALGYAHSDVVHHESELLVLREGLEQSQAEVVELHKAKEFAEAEANSIRACLKSLQKEKLSQDEELKDAKESYDATKELIAELQQQLDTTQQDLTDALAREVRQEESSRSLLAAQKELETAYDAALAQLEAWKRDQGLDSEVEASAEEGDESIEEEDELEEQAELEGSEDDAEESTAIHNTTLEDYDVIDLDAEALDSPPRPVRNTLKNKLRRMVRPVKSSRPSRRAVKLFAVKELKDDLEEYRELLAHLCTDFNSTEISRESRLERLQTQIDETMHLIRLTVTKLKAVRSFSD